MTKFLTLVFILFSIWLYNTPGKVQVILIYHYLTLIRLISMMRINAKATPTNDTNYSCHIKAVVLFNQPYEVHIMPLVIDSLRGRYTCIHIHMNARTHARTHAHNADKITTSARLV